jgi:hypothetical protein
VVSVMEREIRVPYKICSFDIEASSSHGDFPLPVKTYKRLAGNIVDIFIKQSNVLTESMSKEMMQNKNNKTQGLSLGSS